MALDMRYNPEGQLVDTEMDLCALVSGRVYGALSTPDPDALPNAMPAILWGSDAAFNPIPTLLLMFFGV